MTLTRKIGKEALEKREKRRQNGKRGKNREWKQETEKTENEKKAKVNKLKTKGKKDKGKQKEGGKWQKETKSTYGDDTLILHGPRQRLRASSGLHALFVSKHNQKPRSSKKDDPLYKTHDP